MGEAPRPFEVVDINSFEFMLQSTAVQATIALTLPPHNTSMDLADDVESEDDDDDDADMPLSGASAQSHRWDRFLERSFHVDGRPSCLFRYSCPASPKPGSRLCYHHHEITVIMQLTATMNPSPTASHQREVSLHQPAAPDLQSFENLHAMDSKYTVWTINVEYCQPKSALVVP